MIMSHSYRIQDRNCSVYGLGSHLVVAGGELFMAAVLYCEFVRLMNCPYCEADVPAVLPGYNFQTWIDLSHAAAPSYSSLPAGTPESPSSSLPAESPRTTIPPRQTISRRQPASMKFVHLSLSPRSIPSDSDLYFNAMYITCHGAVSGSSMQLVTVRVQHHSSYVNADLYPGTGSFEDGSAGGGEAPQFHVHGHSQWIINATTYGAGTTPFFLLDHQCN
ncbi:hypothetical protein R3P38DRAFT_2849996 [Favolaschia claudopus]|uniref:Uncharacterized protein n=1 Tax=Favolaschia claudopus TaxID=2862362 RepID=A0AAW0DZR9_9AGAR